MAKRPHNQRLEPTPPSAARLSRKPLCAGGAAREVGMVDRCGGWWGSVAS